MPRFFICIYCLTTLIFFNEIGNLSTTYVLGIGQIPLTTEVKNWGLILFIKSRYDILLDSLLCVPKILEK